MPQIEKFGYASATTTVTSAVGSSSRTRSAAEIPASLPPMTTSRIAVRGLAVMRGRVRRGACSTRRRISSRIGRTASTPLPAGSSSTQSSYRLPG